MQVLARSTDATISIGEILADAGLSTRAFYRHFDSKEELLEALMSPDLPGRPSASASRSR